MEFIRIATSVFPTMREYCNRVWNFIRFVYLTCFIPGPSLWSYLTVIVPKTTSLKTTMEVLKTLIDKYHNKPFGIWMKHGHFLLIITDCYSLSEVFRNKHMREKSELYRILSRYLGVGLISNSASENKRIRKLLSPAFRKTALEAHLPRINLEVSRLLEHIQEKADGAEDLNVVPLVFNKSSAVAVSVLSSGAIKFSEVSYMVHCIKFVVELVTLNMISPIWVFQKLLKPRRNHLTYWRQCLDKLRRQMPEFIDAAFEQMQEDGREPENILECLVSGTAEDDLMDHLLHLVGASAETSATAEETCLALLALHPDVQERVFNEIKSIFGGSDRDVEPEDLSNMIYLEMVLKEVLRLFPPAPMIVRNVKEEADFGGILLPKESSVFVDVMSLHRNPNYFKDPLRFDPERFSPENSADIHPFAYLPFSYGSRVCPGQMYAMMTLKTSISRLIRNFIVLPTERLNCIDDIKCNYGFTLEVDDIPLKFKKRN